MENWKVEISRLNSIRHTLGLNWNQLEKLSGKPRGAIARMFQMVNEPSLGFYLTIKTILENEHKVVVKEKKVSIKKEVVLEEIPCDCKMDGLLFIRGKSGCKKTKDEHKF